MVTVSRASARSLSREKPAILLELNREIEVVTLEALIDRLKVMLAKKLKESEWQMFFSENTFVLRLAFGLPIMMVGDQISVGGWKFSGGGGKISDFVLKAAASGNAALIEIKTPETVLLEATPYRRDLHAPGRALSGAVNQVLDQRYQLQKNIQSLKDTSDIRDIETYAVQGLVIAGRTPETKAKLKSLEPVPERAQVGDGRHIRRATQQIGAPIGLSARQLRCDRSPPPLRTLVTRRFSFSPSRVSHLPNNQNPPQPCFFNASRLI